MYSRVVIVFNYAFYFNKYADLKEKSNYLEFHMSRTIAAVIVGTRAVNSSVNPPPPFQCCQIIINEYGNVPEKKHLWVAGYINIE